jgi:hypothetical protein
MPTIARDIMATSIGAVRRALASSSFDGVVSHRRGTCSRRGDPTAPAGVVQPHMPDFQQESDR